MTVLNGARIWYYMRWRYIFTWLCGVYRAFWVGCKAHLHCAGVEGKDTFVPKIKVKGALTHSKSHLIFLPWCLDMRQH